MTGVQTCALPILEIKKDRCKGCGLCVINCPKSCIKLEASLNEKGVHPASFLEDKGCIGCGFCALICPDVRIEVFKDEDRKSVV